MLFLVTFFAPLWAIFICMKMKYSEISSEVREIVESNNFLLIDFVLRGTENNPVIEVYIDNSNSITAEDCAVISRQCNSLFEEKYGGVNYRLEVSSPGVDRSLKYLQQFPKNINRNFELQFEQNGNINKLNGKLTAVKGNVLIFETKKEQLSIDFNNIKSAKVLISL